MFQTVWPFYESSKDFSSVFIMLSVFCNLDKHNKLIGNRYCLYSVVTCAWIISISSKKICKLAIMLPEIRINL